MFVNELLWRNVLLFLKVNTVCKKQQGFWPKIPTITFTFKIQGTALVPQLRETYLLLQFGVQSSIIGG